MKPSTAQMLTSSSKKILFILRVLFALLIVTAIMPWIFPKSALGAFLMSMFSITKFLESQSFDYFLNNLSTVSRILGFLGSVISLLPLFIGVLIMMKLARNYIAERVFSISNAKSYRNLGVIYLLSALLLQPLAQVLFSLSISFINHHLGK